MASLSLLALGATLKVLFSQEAKALQLFSSQLIIYFNGIEINFISILSSQEWIHISLQFPHFFLCVVAFICGSFYKHIQDDE